MSQEMFSFGGRSGIETFRPYAAGDIVTHQAWGRLVIRSVVRDTEAREPEVLDCINLTTGADCITFPREILYRSL
jgi:hypothetical protein